METLRQRRGGGGGAGGEGAGGGVNRGQEESVINRAVDSVFSFVRLAEFEILFVLFFFIAFLLFKDLTSRPEYNQIFVKKPEMYGNSPFFN